VRLLDDLQNSLTRRHGLIVAARSQSLGREVKYAADWINRQPVLTAILAEARHVEEPPAQELWLSECENASGIVWPANTEEGRSLLSWNLLNTLRPEEAVDLAVRIYNRTGSRNIDEMVRRLANEAFTPLFVWFTEQLQRRSSVVYTLRRYLYLTERFNRVALDAEYSTRTSTGEEVYNDDLQKFLFQDAGYVTAAKVRSASGEPHLIGELEGDDPIVLEGKLFDTRGVSYVAKGVRQVYEYALDYRKSVAYLVVFNRTDLTLAVDGDGPADSWPPYLELAGIRVYIVIVRALPPRTTASKMGTMKVVTLGRSDVQRAMDED